MDSGSLKQKCLITHIGCFLGVYAVLFGNDLKHPGKEDFGAIGGDDVMQGNAGNVECRDVVTPT
jgi:hypothetical protein